MALETIDPNEKELRFTVPDAGCLYVGRVVFTYVRLPKGGFDQQMKALQDFLPGASAIFQFDRRGSVVYFPSERGSHVIDLPKKSARVREARDCAVDQLKYESIL